MRPESWACLRVEETNVRAQGKALQDFLRVTARVQSWTLEAVIDTTYRDRRMLGKFGLVTGGCSGCSDWKLGLCRLSDREGLCGRAGCRKEETLAMCAKRKTLQGSFLACRRSEE